MDTLLRLVLRFPELGGVLVAIPGGRLVVRFGEHAPTIVTPATDPVHLFDHPDIEATLLAGRLRLRPGLLTRAATPLVLQRSHALPRTLASRIALAHDEHESSTSKRPPIIAVYDPDEGMPPDAIAARLAFSVALPHGSEPIALSSLDQGNGERPAVAVPEALLTKAVSACSKRGIADVRLEFMIIRAAQAWADACGRDTVTDEDLAWALQWVLEPRVDIAAPDPTQSPPFPSAPADGVAPPRIDPEKSPRGHKAAQGDGVESEATSSSDGEGATPAPLSTESAHSEPEGDTAGQGAEHTSSPTGIGPGNERSLVTPPAAEGEHPAVVPASLTLPSRRPTGGGPSSLPLAGRERAKTATSDRGREARGTSPTRGRTLDLVATLQAAVPWQRLRPRHPHSRLTILPRDLRYKRPVQPPGELLVLLLDASASMWPRAMARAKAYALALLDEAYPRRAHVALIAVRGARPQVLVAPGRRYGAVIDAVKALPAGGGTPLIASLALAEQVARPYTPHAQVHLVLLTDGRGWLPRAEATDRIAHLDAFRTRWEAVGGTLRLASFAEPGNDRDAQRLAATLNAEWITPSRRPRSKAPGAGPRAASR